MIGACDHKLILLQATQRFPDRAYVGIELEINQGIVFAAGRRWVALRATLIDALRAALPAPD